MIKNIVLDMGNVLLTYDPEVCLNHFLENEEDRAVIRKELFEGPEWELVPGAREFCDNAKKKGYKLYVLSNASSSFYDYFLNFSELGYFDGIVVSCDIHSIKPEPDIYRHLFHKYELLPEECIFFDDREENVRAARKEGMQAAIFTGDYVQAEGILKAAAVRSFLMESIDEEYRSFNRSLVPGETAPMLGVRLPKLRETAKKLAKEDGAGYIRGIRAFEEEGEAYHEELLLHGMVIGYMSCGRKERERLIDEFVPYINNWAVCDSSCMTYKFMKKDSEEWFSYLQRYAKSGNEYEIRFAVVSMLDHFVTEQFLERIFEILNKIRHEGYYVKMAAAWAVSVCFVKFPERTKPFLMDNELDDFTQNKSIQKIRESFRASKEDKEEVLKWKR